jgi:hypothetical protein
MTVFFATAIPFNTCAKYFAKGTEVYDEYKCYLVRISAQHVPEYTPVMMAEMVDWLHGLRAGSDGMQHVWPEIPYFLQSCVMYTSDGP